METLERDTITPIDWLRDDVQEFDPEFDTKIVMWQTYSTWKSDADDTNDG